MVNSWCKSNELPKISASLTLKIRHSIVFSVFNNRQIATQYAYTNAHLSMRKQNRKKKSLSNKSCKQPKSYLNDIIHVIFALQNSRLRLRIFHINTNALTHSQAESLSFSLSLCTLLFFDTKTNEPFGLRCLCVLVSILFRSIYALISNGNITTLKISDDNDASRQPALVWSHSLVNQRVCLPYLLCMHLFVQSTSQSTTTV